MQAILIFVFDEHFWGKKMFILGPYKAMNMLDQYGLKYNSPNNV